MNLYVNRNTWQISQCSAGLRSGYSRSQKMIHTIFLLANQLGAYLKWIWRLLIVFICILHQRISVFILSFWPIYSIFPVCVAGWDRMVDQPLWEQIGSSFVQHYYAVFDSERENLGAIYVSVTEPGSPSVTTWLAAGLGCTFIHFSAAPVGLVMFSLCVYMLLPFCGQNIANTIVSQQWRYSHEN